MRVEGQPKRVPVAPLNGVHHTVDRRVHKLIVTTRRAARLAPAIILLKRFSARGESERAREPLLLRSAGHRHPATEPRRRFRGSGAAQLFERAGVLERVIVR